MARIRLRFQVLNTSVNAFLVGAQVYTYLLKQIAPQEAGVDLSALGQMDLLARAEQMLQQADKLGCRSFVTPEDVVNGVYKARLPFFFFVCFFLFDSFHSSVTVSRRERSKYA